MMKVDKEFEPVAEAIKGAVAVARNGFSEICLAMDSAELDKFRRYGYEIFVSSPGLMLARVIGWYRNTCCLGSVTKYSRDPDGSSFATLLVSKDNKEVK